MKELFNTGIKCNYQEAQLHCFLCNHNGHKDWRLPTRNEYAEYLLGSGAWDTEDRNLTRIHRRELILIRDTHD